MYISMQRLCMASQGIKALSELGVPIYITETGIADEKGDRRPIFFETYFAEVLHASHACVAAALLHELALLHLGTSDVAIGDRPCVRHAHVSVRPWKPQSVMLQLLDI